MPDSLYTLTRQQIAEFVKNPRTIRALEQAIHQSNKAIPDTLPFAAETAQAKANQANVRSITTEIKQKSNGVLLWLSM